MRIAVLSDTHVKTSGELPAPLLKALAGVDLIIHAGDFTERAVLDQLKALAEVKAVCGNMDSGEIRRMLPQKDLFVLGGKRIGLTHGWGPPWGIEMWIRKMFTEADLIIFGHSHKACHRYLQGSLMFNPGRARESYGLLTIEDEIKAEIVAVSETSQF